MANIKIVTDSSITIEPEVVEEYGITIVPLSVMVDGVLYSDSELGEGDFLRLMQSSKIFQRPANHLLESLRKFMKT